MKRFKQYLEDKDPQTLAQLAAQEKAKQDGEDDKEDKAPPKKDKEEK